MAGINPRHFLAGGMVREEAASAFLATLIDQSDEFRQRFFQLCGIESFPVNSVVVEQGRRDVTVEGTDTLLIIENKIAAGAKMKGQLVGYYRRCKEDNPDVKIHSVYLAPSRELGQSEVDLVQADDGEVVVAVAWVDLESLCAGLSDIDQVFAESGVKHILEAIARRRVRSSNREWSPEEQVLREMIQSISAILKPQLPQRELTPFGPELWAYGPVTVVVKCVPTLSIDEEATDRRTVVELMFRLAGKNKDRDHAKRWIDPIKAQGTWEGFQIDSESNWMVSKEVVTGGDPQLADFVASRFIALIAKIDEGVGKMTDDNRP